MARIDKMLETQISLSEWLQRIGHKDAVELNKEDNDKRERLGVLKRIINLPFDQPVQFTAEEIRDRAARLTDYVSEHGDELCALRLMPLSDSAHLPKLRMRGKSVKEALQWFDEQKIDASQYRADYVPHTDKSQWATIFVVNEKGAFGEIYFGGHHILTQGFHEEKAPITFSWDFNEWKLIPHNDDALKHLKGLVEMITVTSKDAQNKLKDELNAAFVKDYLKGYFETTSSKEFGVWFIDYNRILGDYLQDFTVHLDEDNGESLLQGRPASQGRVTGRVRIVSDPAESEFKDGEILICQMTSPDYLPLMQKAAAIVTDEGGILCHAAIVARELGKPCIVSTGEATTKLHNGQEVEVDATEGVVKATS